MSWRGRKVLVTGAGGFIGSYLTERLVELGADVRAMVHYNAFGRRGWLDYSAAAASCNIIQGDVSDHNSMDAAAEGCDTIFHLAALIAIPYSYLAPVSYLRNNAEGTINALQSARKVGVRRFVHTSSSEVYGTAQYVPIDEKHPLQGQSPYSASKIAADKIAEAFYRSYAVPVVTVRPFNTFGPRQSSRAVIPTVIAQCLAGDKVKLGAVSPTRDLNYISNTIDGFIAAAEAEGVLGEAINLGSGEEISVGELAKLIAQLVGRDIEIEHDEHRLRPQSSEVERLVADNRKARELLHWEPRIGLEEGLKVTIEWLRVNQSFYRTGEYVV